MKEKDKKVEESPSHSPHPPPKLSISGVPKDKN